MKYGETNVSIMQALDSFFVVVVVCLFVVVVVVFLLLFFCFFFVFFLFFFFFSVTQSSLLALVSVLCKRETLIRLLKPVGVDLLKLT